MRGYSPKELVAAATYLELALERLPQVIGAARLLAPTVGGVRAVERIAYLPDEPEEGRP